MNTFISKIKNSAVALNKIWSRQEGRNSDGRRSSVYNDYTNFEITDDMDDQLNKSDLRDFLEVYQTLHWMFVCVKTIADSCALLPLRVINSDDKEYIGYEHDFIKLLKNPNNLQTKFDLITKTVSYYCLVGNSYWFLERDNSSITKLHTPRPDRVESVPKTNGEVDWKRKRTNKTPEEWSMKDVVHFYSFNPTSDYQGFGMAQGSQQAAIIELYNIIFGKRFFQNAVMPSMIFKVPEFLDDSSYERILVELKRLHVGVEKFFNVALLEGGVDPVDLKKTTPADADYRENKVTTREEIFTTMGCYHLVSLLNGEGASSVRQAYKLFYELTVIPLLRNFEDTINKELLSQFDDSENMEVEFDLRNAPGLREDELQESQADYRYWTAGIKTANEIRRTRGFGRNLDWGDQPPPMLGMSRSRMSPNEFRSDDERLYEHPERFDQVPAEEELPGGSISEYDVDDMNEEESKQALKYLIRKLNSVL